MDGIIELVRSIGENPWLIVILVILAFGYVLRGLGKQQNSQADALDSMRKLVEENNRQNAAREGGLNATIAALKEERDAAENRHKDAIRQSEARSKADIESVRTEARNEVITLTEKIARLETQQKELTRQLEEKSKERDQIDELLKRTEVQLKGAEETARLLEEKLREQNVLVQQLSDQYKDLQTLLHSKDTEIARLTFELTGKQLEGNNDEEMGSGIPVVGNDAGSGTGAGSDPGSSTT